MAGQEPGGKLFGLSVGGRMAVVWELSWEISWEKKSSYFVGPWEYIEL